MLEVRSLAVSYGQHRALKGVDLQVAPGEIVVILGANGAGKTSLLQATAGLVSADDGSRVRLEGQALSGQPPHRIVEAGLALVPEGRGIFADLSVRENLLLGAFAHRARARQGDNLERVFGLFPKLAERSAQLPRTMSGGEQQMVAIGRALMSAPTILMLDEPSLGLSPLLCIELFKTLQAVRDSGVGILLVEQNARQSLAIADRAYLLENGEIVGQGRAADLARDPAVQAAYLGGAAANAPAPLQSAPAPAALPTRKASPAPASAAATPAPATWLPCGIDELVRVATRRQAEDLRLQRGTAGATDAASRALAELRASGALDAAVRGIEASAAVAVRTTQTAIPAPATTSATTPASGLEVWRRPGIEIHRRQPDGSFKREE